MKFMKKFLKNLFAGTGFVLGLLAFSWITWNVVSSAHLYVLVIYAVGCGIGIAALYTWAEERNLWGQ